MVFNPKIGLKYVKMDSGDNGSSRGNPDDNGNKEGSRGILDSINRDPRLQYLLKMYRIHVLIKTRLKELVLA
jgi:hypothetical protein